MRYSGRLALAGVAVLLLAGSSGCLHPRAPDVAREDAEAVAVDGMRQLAAALADADAGRLSSFEMIVTAPAGTETEHAGNLTARLDWGQSGVSRRHVVLEDETARHETTIWCTSRFVYYEWEGAVYQERRFRDPTRGDPCRFDGIDQARDLLEPFTPEGAEALPMPEVYATDGEVTAVFEFEDGDRLVVRHDGHGFVTHVEGGGPEGRFDAYVTYGPREHLVPPEATERIPAHVETARVPAATPDSAVYEVIVSWHGPELHEIEARWVARDPTDGAEVVLLSYPLRAEAADAPFTFDDVDTDGRVTAGDRYTFQEPAPEVGAVGVRELVLFDVWAGAEVNAPVPGVAGPLLALALVGLMAAVRRRTA